MSMMSKMYLAAAVAVGLVAPVGAQAAVEGFSIALTDVVLDYQPVTHDLSASAPAFGDQSAIPLANNGEYLETLTGDYAVVDNLPPLDKSDFWNEYYQITLNGKVVFGHSGLVGPYSVDQIWQAILGVSKLNPKVAALLITILETKNTLNTNGLFDYAYNFEPGDRNVGTFALGSTKDAAGLFGLAGQYPPGVNDLSLKVSLFAVPEPPTWLMLGAGLLVVGVIRSQARRFRSAHAFIG
jgi:hypothetical protein